MPTARKLAKKKKKKTINFTNMKVYRNIGWADEKFRDKLKEVIDALVPLRDDRSRTEAYYDKHLENDWAYEAWRAGKRDWELRTHYRRFPDFKLPPGAIQPGDAREFRRALLEVIKDDKYSFGYLYFLLASEVNRENKCVLLPCIPDTQRIKYAIQYDPEEVREEVEKIDDFKKKLQYLSAVANDSSMEKYKGEAKTVFEEQLLNIIEDEVFHVCLKSIDYEENIKFLIYCKHEIAINVYFNEALIEKFADWANEEIKKCKKMIRKEKKREAIRKKIRYDGSGEEEEDTLEEEEILDEDEGFDLD